MQTVRLLFKPFLKCFVKNESENPDKCIAYSINIPFVDAPVAVIELTGQIHNGSYEIVNFYVWKIFSKIGIGRYLLELSAKQIKELKIDSIVATPVGITDRHIPELTKEERVMIYEHLGFIHTGNGQMVKRLA